jgi:hypothetical protein
MNLSGKVKNLSEGIEKSPQFLKWKYRKEPPAAPGETGLRESGLLSVY